ncbi:MAG: hypothetical protein IT347_10955 [Candidatus Eisenbacteria bacterium]|nr:hypothetical protein [Candidatus Eisenbacteria bacterium]
MAAPTADVTTPRSAPIAAPPPAPAAAASPTPADLRVQGEVVLYRLYDLGYEIDLDRVFALLAESAPERPLPVRGEAQAIHIPNPPVTAALGTETLSLAGSPCAADFSVRVFDFGVLSLRARVAFPAETPWREYVAAGTALANAPQWREVFLRVRERFVARIAPAITKPGDSPVSEDYAVFRVNRLCGPDGGRLGSEALREEDVARLLLGETRPLSAGARRDLLSQRFTYFEDDLAVLTWNAALVVEPVPEDTDVQYVLEFANAQLLELRYYDAQLDRELPRMYDRIEQARRGLPLFDFRYSRLLASLQARVADATELVERTENSLKMTDDVFLARIYAAALEIFRGRTWRAGIAGKLAIVRDAYTMLNGESQARRSEMLELVIVLLIVLEIVVAFWRA